MLVFLRHYWETNVKKVKQNITHHPKSSPPTVQIPINYRRFSNTCSAANWTVPLLTKSSISCKCHLAQYSDMLLRELSLPFFVLIDIMFLVKLATAQFCLKYLHSCGHVITLNIHIYSLLCEHIGNLSSNDNGVFRSHFTEW